MTTAELARQLGIPASRIRQWAKRGTVKRNPDGTVNAYSLIAKVDPRLAEEIAAHIAA